MTMAYGTEQAYASNQVYFRTFTDASITSSTDTAATISVTSGIQYKDSRGLIGSCSKIVGQALYKEVGSTWSTMSERYGVNIYVEPHVTSSWTAIGEYSKTATTSVTKTHSAQTLTFYTEIMITTAAYGNVPAESAMATGDVTITVPAKTSYTVAYNANGGSGAPSSQTKWYGEALGLSSSEPTRTGYVFKSWNTASDGSGTTYAPGASYTANAQATLYAQWEPSLKITSVNIVRCDSSGNSDAMGGYVEAVVAWQTDSSISGASLALSCASPSASATVALSGSSGTTTVGPMAGPYRADTTYSFTVTLTDSLSNTVSETAVSTASSTGYTMPVVSTVSAIRSDSLGSPDDNGEYCFTTFSWAIASIGSQTAPTSCTVKAYEYGSQTAMVTQSVTLTGFNGTKSLLVGGGVYSTDKQYTVEVTLSDALNTATKSDVMSTGYFTMDVLAGGRGIAMGKPATQVDVLDVGYDIHSDSEVEATDANHVVHKLTEKANTSIVVTGVKGNAESSYRTGNVNITPANIGADVKGVISDAGNGKAITMQYSGSGISSATWFAAWNGYKIDAISAANTRSAIGAAPSSHTHSFLTTPDTRSNNQNPSWYLSNYGSQIVCEFKSRSAIGAPGSSSYIHCLTLNTWYDASGGYPSQIAIGNDQQLCWRTGNSGTGWGAWRSTSKTVLYDNTSGANGTVTLSASAANYNHMRIYYRNASGQGAHVNQYNTTDVYSPNGKYVNLAVVGPDNTSDLISMNTRLALISGTTINNARSVSGNLGSSGGSSGVYNEVYIVRVEAWNE